MTPIFLSKSVEAILSNTPNPVIFEVGACDGRYTLALFMSSKKGNPTIYSFEPDPRNANLCERETERFAPYVKFIPAALGKVTGKVPFYLAAPQPNGEIGSSSLSRFKDVTAAFPWCKCLGTAQVDCWRLDDFCAKHDVRYIDLLFADVQGAELLMLEGGQQMLRKTHYVWTEFEGLRADQHGTLYEDSCSLEQVHRALPDWQSWAVRDVQGGDALLENTRFQST